MMQKTTKNLGGISVKNKVNALVRNFSFEEVRVPLEAIIGTIQARLLDLEEVLDPATGELKAVKLICGVGIMKSGVYMRSFSVKIPTLINKLSEDDVAEQPYIELENAYVVPYAFNTDRGIVRGATAIADDFTVISEDDVEVVL